MTTEELAVVPRDWENVSAAEVIERVVLDGDLAVLTPEQRVAYYARVCESLGLNPFTRPFDYIRLKGRGDEPAKMILYAKRDATDQIRRNLRINVTAVEPAPPMEGLYGLIAHVRTQDGREDTGTAYVNVKGLGGDWLANALMKCETKAKRRATLSIAGLGIIDESEVGSIPDGELVAVDDSGVIKPGPTTVSDVIAARVAAIEQATDGVDPVGPAVPGPVAGVGLTEPVGTSDADYASVEDETDGLDVSTPELRIATPEEVVDDESGMATLPDDAVLPPARAMDLNAFAAYVADRGQIVPRDEMRAIAATMFPDATGFRMLSDEQRGAIATEIDRLVAERATDDDAEEDDEPTDAEIIEVDALATAAPIEDRCLAPSPFSDARCDSTPGHVGPHRSGDNESW